jgi:DNA invertase Pin-like site-specific DNA recombinase
MGKAMLQIGAVFAEMERNLLRERTKAGLAAARDRGRLGGRKPRLSADGLDTARRLMADPLLTMDEVASRLGVGRTTLYRALGRARAKPVSGTTVATKTETKARRPGRKSRVPVAPTSTERN